MTRYWDDNIGNKDWEPVTWNKKKENTIHKKEINLPYNKILGNAILAARRKMNLSQKKISDRLHIKQSKLNSYETGEIIPDVTIISKLNKILKTQLPLK